MSSPRPRRPSPLGVLEPGRRRRRTADLIGFLLFVAFVLLVAGLAVLVSWRFTEAVT